jgi:tripartite-type tricarboxylate transporter receptor subunit TctC
MSHVLYKDLGQLYFAVGNNEVAWAFGTAGSAGAAYRAKRVRFLAVAAPQRMAGYEDVPTVVESGGPSGFEVRAWMALVAPRGTPAGVIAQVNSDIGKTLREPDLAERYATFGFEPMGLSPVELTRLIDADSRRFGELARRLNLSLE